MFSLKDNSYVPRYKARGIPFRDKMGIDVSDCSTSEEVMIKAKLDYHVSKCQLAASMPASNCGGNREGKLLPNIVNGIEFVDLKGAFATYRTDTNIPLGTVRSRYEPVQNIQAFNFFDTAIGDSIKWQTAGYLGYGEKIFVSAKVDRPMNIGGFDAIDQYLLFTNSHDGNSPVQIMLTPIRLACLNALNAARAAALANISFRHNQGVNTKLLTVPEILCITKQKIEDEEEMYNFMFKKKVDDVQVQKYIAQSFMTDKEFEIVDTLDLYKPLFKRDNTAFEQSGISKQKLNTIVDTWRYTNEGLGQKELEGTIYGAYNGVAGYFSNIKPYKDEEKRLESEVLGTDYIIKQRALALALDF